MTIEPASSGEIAAILAAATRDGKRVAIRGAGTKADWSAPAPQADVVLSTGRLDAIVAHRHGDLTATVQAGARLADVNRALARHGQWIPLDPPFADRATIGGIVSANDSGPRRHRYGAPRDLIIGADFVRADGVAAKAGGIVVKNVAGYDVARLLTGSFGSLAFIVSATFKLYPLPPASRTVVVDCATDRAGSEGTRPTADSRGAPGDSRSAPGDSRSAQALAKRLGALVSSLLSSQLTPTAIEVQVPPGRLLVRFETIEIAADEQAAAVVKMAADAGADAAILQGDAEATLWEAHGERPWNGQGAIVKVTCLPGDLAGSLEWIAGSGADYDIVGRAGVGAFLLRVGGDVSTQARTVAALRARHGAGRGAAVLVRGSDELKALVDVWGPMGDALPLMRAVKERFDPRGILNPGRGPGGL